MSAAGGTQAAGASFVAARACCRRCCACCLEKARSPAGAPAHLCAAAAAAAAAAGTLIGCLPNNLFAVNAGAHLGELQSLGDLYSGKLVLLGLTAGAAALTPVYFQRRAAARHQAAADLGKRA